MYFLIENFAGGVDLRRSKEVGGAGTLRVLNNAIINEGGEIEKRKAFTLHEGLTGYGQVPAYKGRLTGPHPVPGQIGAAFFRHHHDSLPGGFTAGAGSVARYVDYGVGQQSMRFWVMKTSAALSSLGALLHVASYSEFADSGYMVEQWVKNPDRTEGREHVSFAFTNGEPTGETIVAANQDRAYQITLGQRGYVVDGNDIYLSAVNAPDNMAGTGSGVLTITSNGQPIGGIIALGDYFGQLAVFGPRGVQFYAVDPDPALMQYLRTLQASTFAPRSVTGYANGDLIYLASSGIRSLRARDSSNLAAVSDVGSPIDRMIRDMMDYDADEAEPIFSGASPSRPVAEHFRIARGMVHPRDGAFWLFLQHRVLVLSRHSGANVAAWSTFDLPVPASDHVSDRNGLIKGRWCADACQIGETIAFRNFADEVFIYGGEDGNGYDDSLAEVVTPFLDMGHPMTRKSFIGIDIVCEGEWTIEAATIVGADDSTQHWAKVADVDGPTRMPFRVPMAHYGTQIALRLTSRSVRAAKVSQIGIMYDLADQK